MKKPKSRRSASRKTSSKTPPPPSMGAGILKTIFGVTLLALVVLTAALVARQFIPTRPQTPPEKPSKLSSPPVSQKAPKAKTVPPTFEIYPPEEKPSVPPLPRKKTRHPQVALILDDVGYDRAMADRFMKLGVDITVSILPLSPFQRSIAKKAHERGFEVMLHLPMEPFEYPDVDPGPGTLMADMTPDQLITQLNKDLSDVPYIQGVNNHMGSKLTTMSTKLYQVFTILKKKNLYFVDSRTTKDTLCRPSARLLQINYAERDVFLDHVHEVDAIRKQIRRLIHTAQKNGTAIGIGHPSHLTYQVLKEELPTMKQKVDFVFASALVHPVGTAANGDMMFSKK